MKKGVAVPPYLGSEQAWASYEKWPVGLCEHRVKFLSISTRSHISRKIVFCLHFECCCFYYFRLYHLHYALNREVPIMKNAQYSHATILRYCMEKSKRSHILKIDRLLPYPCVEQQNCSYRKWSAWLCEHCVKFLANSMRSHFFGWKRGWPYRRTQALNRHVPVMRNDQYDCENIM